ncbi:hypothetical protein EJ110_NYTH28354 [Nymphaea thermarum]|nr:hypothetical protein EJ110_NYTH28354 [Nymphaea thermarum]
MTIVCPHPNERFCLHRTSYLSINSSRRRSTLLCLQAGIAVKRCTVRRIHNGFRLPIPSSYFHEWKIRSPRAAQSESTVSSDENSGGGEADNVEISVDGDVYRSTLRLVECAMFAAVTGLVYYLSNSLAIEVATAMLLLTLSGPLKACTYLLMHGILGLAMGSLWRLFEIMSLVAAQYNVTVHPDALLLLWFTSRLGANWLLSITLCTLVRATGALGYVLISSFLLRENILSLIAINLHASLSYMLAALGVNVIPSMKTIYTIFGTLLLLNCGFFVFLLHMLYAVFISRLGMRFSLVLPGWLEKAL